MSGFAACPPLGTKAVYSATGDCHYQGARLKPLRSTSYAPSSANVAPVGALNSLKPVAGPPPRVFFCNGINNTPKDVQKFAKIFKACTGVEPEIVYNHATCPTRINKLSSFSLGTTVLNATGALVSLFTFPLLTPAFVATTAASGACVGKELHAIQHDKEDEASKMAQRVRAYLTHHPKAHVVLVAHSQGAHVTDMALDQLKDLKGRIRVITIGGLVSICKKKAAQVVNLVNKGDSVAGSLAPNYLSFLGNFKPKCKGTACAPSGTAHLGHSAKDYLNAPAFHHYFQAYMKA